MRIAVLGAGVVGTAAAYYLARDGHEVTVIERHSGPAEGTSKSNAGLVSPGDATSWASPAALSTFVRSLYTPGLGIKVRFSADPRFLSWAMRFLRQCTKARAAANTDIKLRLALYSRRCINEVTAETGIAYDDLRMGIVYFYRSQQGLDAGASHMQYLADRGLRIEVVDREKLIELEPALAVMRHKLAGAIYSPMDQTGDSRLFAERLAAWTEARLAAKFLYEATVNGLDVEGGRVRSVLTSAGSIHCDAAVVSLGPESGLFGHKIGLKLPVYPVKGYTVTAPLEDEGKGPMRGGVDDERLMAYSRLGNRLRLASTAEFAGYDRTHKPADFIHLLAVARELFPGLIDERKAVLWAGLRPMTPSSVPMIGRARYDNLFLDTGHGHLGWTLACGSGKLLADIVARRKPEVDPQGLEYRD